MKYNRILIIGGSLALAAISSSAMAADVRLCTGGEGFPYNASGKFISQNAQGSNINIVVVETKGTTDNVRRTFDVAADDPEACDAFIGQPDAVLAAKRTNASLQVKQIAKLHREYLQVGCNKSSGIDNLSEVAGTSKSVNIGPIGGGAWATWQNFLVEDDSYKSVVVRNESDKIALGSVSAGDTDCMIVAAGLGNSTMTEMNDYYADSINLVEATDWDFNDAKDLKGEPLYEFKDIDRTYKNLQGWMGGARETVSWRAGVYVNPARMDDKTLGDFITYTNRSKAEIVKAFGD